MKNQLSLNIKTPCQENFNQFEATPNGGFCGSCEQEVVDFTNKSPKDIEAFFNLNTAENTCGIFKSNQLNNPLRAKKYGILSGVGLACLALFSMSTIHAQDTRTQSNSNQISTTITQDSFVVKGNVSDDIEPIPGVNVVLDGTEFGTVTDFDGNFEFPEKLKKGDVLVFSYIGMESQKVIIENKTSASDIALKINMTLDTVIIMGKVAVKGVYKSNKSK
ncbi:carboxypeptidase-like regulatory domain-containing protein [Lacinutrix jangbogonensis]|uniref:carboxypeptidase-like regulatory domain-containing protein n=1 Tax=Lacinutrix jangbogonensis TaxID=1469557 RepID=UPI00053D4A39|nr:carboxypeptidase-like regulatory domain-containing protein [Lacinutrix jangbogonensis]